MKTEHEMLKEICDEIGYGVKYPFNNIKLEYWIYSECWECGNIVEFKPLNIREIIFTQDFMYKYISHLDSINLLWEVRNYEQIGKWLIVNLDNPVQYLYNTLWLWE